MDNSLTMAMFSETVNPRCKNTLDYSKQFISNAVSNLCSGSALYNEEYCFTKEQAEEIVRIVRNRKRIISLNLTASYELIDGMYVIMVKPKGRPSTKQLRKMKKVKKEIIGV